MNKTEALFRAYLDYYFRPNIRASFGGPFNGQDFRKSIFLDLMNSCEFGAIVETGTFRGTTTEYFAQSFDIPVYSTESALRFFYYAKKRLKKFKNRVNLKFGDSVEFLKNLANDSSAPKDRVFFYLDAHWYGYLPLNDELEIIFRYWNSPVVMIDDFKVPDSDYKYDDYGESGILDLDYIRPSIKKYNLSTFFPSKGAESETGSKRGCVVLCDESLAASKLGGIDSLTKYN